MDRQEGAVSNWHAKREREKRGKIGKIGKGKSTNRERERERCRRLDEECQENVCASSTAAFAYR